MLRGRDVDQEAVAALLDRTRDGGSGALVIRGDPGIGKTSLLGCAEEHADGMTVLRGTGIETEAEIPFASLHLLLHPVLDRADALPGPQAEALKGAFGLVPATGGDELLVGLAVLSLLAEVADETPLLCLIDDAHWLDQASASALRFAAHRLRADGIAMIFGARDGFDPSGLPERRLTGLDPDSAALLLADTAPGLTEPMRRRIMAESCGNPLALRELPRTVDRVGHNRAPLPLPERLRTAYTDSIARLPADAQTLLLVVALAGGGELDTILGAGARLGIERSALSTAERFGLVRVGDGQVAFTHPLMRAAAAQLGTFDLRQAVHRSLAELVGPGDRRAWHLAAAATGPDEGVALALEQTARRARDRSGHAGASAALERAAELTPDPGTRAGRLTSAAVAAADAGQADRAKLLAELATRLVTDPLPLARLAELRARVAFDEGAPREAHDLLMSGADGIAGLDRVAAGLMLVDAARNAWQLSDPARLAEAADRLYALGLRPEDGLTPAIEAVAGASAFLHRGPADALPIMRGLVATGSRIRRGEHALRVNAAFVAGLVGDFESGRAISAAVSEECRASGEIGKLPLAHLTLAASELYLGRFTDVVATATEGLALAADTGQPNRAGYLEGMLAWIAAVRGDGASCAELADRCLDRYDANKIVNGLAWAQWARALLDLGQGRFAEALDRLNTAMAGPVRHQIQAVYFAPDQVEAAVRLGLPAGEPLRRLAEWSAAAELDWAAALVHRCRALLEPDGDAAHDHFRRALAGHATSGRPFETARTRLVFGERLRRERRKGSARPQLRAALEIFERLGARPWAERARTELRAAGDTSAPSTSHGARASLSPQELQVVRLAAEGLTNKEIGAQLFLSPKTVSYHLYRAFPKLNVASRAQLAGLDLG